MSITTEPVRNINVLFFGNHPFFLNLEADLDRAGCRSLFSEIVYSDSPRFIVLDTANLESGYKSPYYGVSITPKERSGAALLPEQITSPEQAITYARAYLSVHGYSVEELTI